MNTRSIIQTQELIAAAAVLILRGRDILTDKKVSFFEIIGLVREWPVLKTAIEGVQDVPTELLDLSADESVQIGEQIAAFMVELGLPHKAGDVTQELVSLASEAVRVWVRIANLPPVPEVVE